MSVQELSNQQVEMNLKDLVTKERKLLHVILLHIQQIDTRRIYLDRAYSSTYEYLIKELSYSSSAAMRRLGAARMLKQIPSMSSQIESGKLNLSQIGELSRAVKEKEKQSGIKISLCQKQEILESISGKSIPESQKEISVALDIDLKKPEQALVQKDDSIVLSITLTKEQYEKLNKCRNQLAHLLMQKQAGCTWADLIELLSDRCLREKLQIVKRATEESASSEISTTHTVAAAEVKRVNKTMTQRTRKIVIERDECCQHTDLVTGRKCESTFALEVDHKMPVFAGGDNSLENLQALCRKHNAYKYQQQAQIRFL